MVQAVTKQNTFEQWRVLTNEIITEIGSLNSLPTVDKTTVINALIEIDDEITQVIADVGDLSTLSTTSKLSIVSSVNEVDTALDALSTTVTSLSDKIGTLSSLSTVIKTDIVSSVNELYTTKAERKSQVYINLDDNNGRFCSETGIMASTTINSVFLSPINSSSMSIVDKFINDNSTNGGAGSTLPSNVSSLLTELSTAGRTELRYGAEFYILDVTAGNGTDDGILVNTVDYYPIISSDEILGRIGENITWQGWVKTSTAGESIILGDASTTLDINGTSETTPYVLSETDGWVFVKMVKILTKEYESNFPAIRAENSTVTHIALSGIFEGDCDIGTHLGVV